MSIKPEKVQFNGGELSPWLEGRTDIAKYDKTAKLCRNFIPLAEGCLRRRGGTRFVSFTLDEQEVMLKIIANPVDAVVIIDGQERNSICVARGDKVSYEVKAEGYASKFGECYVNDDMEIKVDLVSMVEMCKINIVATPSDAIIKIEGYERSSAEFYKNLDVFYMVYKDGYVMQSATVKVTEDMTIYVDLVEDEVEENEPIYEDWGAPVGFVNCTALGSIEKQRKCILLKFEKGYLPIVFDAELVVPEEINRYIFIYDTYDGYNGVAKVNGEYQLCIVSRGTNALYYRDKEQNLVWAIDSGTQKAVGWQTDENGKYALFYELYDGSVSGNAFKIYYKGELVWTIEGRD